jgi:flagellar protein FliO/FliZ
MNEPISFGWLFFKTLLAMGFIIVLALVSIRWILPKLSGARGRSKGRVKILDVQPLEMRKSVYIIEIDGRQLALGVTEHNITPLCELQEGAPGKSFAAVLNTKPSAETTYQPPL